MQIMMKNLMIYLLFILQFILINLSAQNHGIATQILRPAFIDTSGIESQGAVLVSLSDYPSDLVKYRLFNGASQHYCWDAVSNSFVTSTSYTNAPLASGTPKTSSKFWIIFQRGSNNSPVVSYRDRLDPFTANYNTVPLSRPVTIKQSFELTGKLTGMKEGEPNSKYVILAFSSDELINASSTEPETGSFQICLPNSSEIDKIEVRSIDDNKVAELTGKWTTTGTVGDILLSNRTGNVKERAKELTIFPVPAEDEIFIKGLIPIQEIEVIDITGKILQKLVMDEETESVSVYGLSPGIYFLKAGHQTGIFIKK